MHGVGMRGHVHPEARRWIEGQVAQSGPFVSVLEIGSRNINGGVRDLFPNSVFEGVDLVEGDGVDFVCDASVSLPSGPYDAAMCFEVFEHTAAWPQILANVYDVLMPDGVLILTMAGPGRAPHSAVDGGQVRPGEFYANVQPAELFDELSRAGFVDVLLRTTNPGDLYASCVKER